MNDPLIEHGFAVVGAGAWLFGRAQPAAVRGTLRSSGLKGFICPDRGSLTRGDLAEEKSHAEFAESAEGSPPSLRGDAAERQGGDSHAEFAEPMRSSDLESQHHGLETGGEVASPKETPRPPRPPRDQDNTATGADGARAWCASSACPFLTHIPCGVPVSAVSDKVLVAPASARTGAKLVKVIPLSFARSIRTTIFSHPERDEVDLERGSAASNARAAGFERSNAAEGGLQRGEAAWVVMATRSRTTRIALADGESLGVRPEAAVAWTGPRPTGFCPRLRLLDILLPRGPRDLLLHFHGPAIVWIEGSEPRPLRQTGPRKAVF